MKNKQLSVIIRVLFLAIVTSCGTSDNGSTSAPSEPSEPSSPATNPQAEIRTVQIRDHQQECIGVAVFPCLYTKSPDQSDWSLFYDAIEGFDYEWGYNYEVTLSVTPIDNPLADGSSLLYTLRDIISKTPVAAEYRFRYASRYAAEVITKKSDSAYALFSFPSKEFNCIPADCETLDSLLNDGRSILFEFRHPEGLSGALILEQIVCHSSQVLFTETCLQAATSNDTNDNIEKLDIELLLLDKFDQVSSTFSQGETIGFSLSVSNKTSDTITLEFASGQRFDIIVRADDQSEVWRWSADKVFTQAIVKVEIGPMETLNTLEIWNQLPPDGSQLPAGQYNAIGYYQNQSMQVEKAFTIQ